MKLFSATSRGHMPPYGLRLQALLACFEALRLQNAVCQLHRRAANIGSNESRNWHVGTDRDSCSASTAGCRVLVLLQDSRRQDQSLHVRSFEPGLLEVMMEVEASPESSSACAVCGTPGPG